MQLLAYGIFLWCFWYVGRRSSSVGPDWRDSGVNLAKSDQESSMSVRSFQKNWAKRRMQQYPALMKGAASMGEKIAGGAQPPPPPEPPPVAPPLTEAPRDAQSTQPTTQPVVDPSLQTAVPQSLISGEPEEEMLIKSVTQITETKTGTLLIPVHQRSIPTSHFSLDEQMFLPPDPPAFFYAHWIMTKPKMMFGNCTVYLHNCNICMHMYTRSVFVYMCIYIVYTSCICAYVLSMCTSVHEYMTLYTCDNVYTLS